MGNRAFCCFHNAKVNVSSQTSNSLASSDVRSNASDDEYCTDSDVKKIVDKDSHVHRHSSDRWSTEGALPEVFDFRTLHTATFKFSKDRVLGEGAFGKVYKGWLKVKNEQIPATARNDAIPVSRTRVNKGVVEVANGQIPATARNDAIPVSCKDDVSKLLIPVAVKRLNAGSTQGEAEWLQEILMLSRFHHPNLVRLIGYCAEQDEGLLVYEFMPLGSLDYHLFPDSGFTDGPLAWNRRLQIALGIATGVAFLHDKNVIFRDLKPANVLLDSSYNPKLTDFGFAKIADAYRSICETRLVGDSAYLCPQYLETGLLHVNCDVFSFGVLLLELLTGQRAVDVSRMPAVHLRHKLLFYLNDPVQIMSNVIDRAIRDELSAYEAETAVAVCKLARACIKLEIRARPSMKDVATWLKHRVGAEWHQN